MKLVSNQHDRVAIVVTLTATNKENKNEEAADRISPSTITPVSPTHNDAAKNSILLIPDCRDYARSRCDRLEECSV